jgi:hypothetical protein
LNTLHSVSSAVTSLVLTTNVADHNADGAVEPFNVATNSKSFLLLDHFSTRISLFISIVPATPLIVPL